MQKDQQWLPWLLFFTLACLVLPLCFWNLDSIPLRKWDESRLAMNSLEMFKNGDWITTHFDGKPDMWNTKPPLLIWAQVATMKLSGPSDLAVRLPSAIAALLTMISLLVFSRIYLRNYLIGFLAALILATAPGFMNWHGARAADYDAPMIFWTTFSCLAFFLFTETLRTRYLYLFFGTLTMGILTKGVGAMLLLPGLFLYATLTRQIPTFLRKKDFYFGLGILVLLVGGYYALRNHHNPGFVATVWKNELGGRYLKAIEGHGESPFFFLTNLWHTRLGYWIILIPFGMLTGFIQRKSSTAKLARFLTLLVLSFFLVITLGQTKCRWYDLPMYPFLGLFISLFLFFALSWIQNLDFIRSKRLLGVLPFLVLGFLFFKPYKDALEQVQKPENQGGYYSLGYVLKESLAGQRELDGARILIDGYSPQNDFYIQLLQMRGIDIERSDWDNLVAEDLVLTTDKKIEDELLATYVCELVDKTKWVKTYSIKGRLKP